jgi:hypothetical protein
MRWRGELTEKERRGDILHAAIANPGETNHTSWKSQIRPSVRRRDARIRVVMHYREPAVIFA